MFVFAMSADQVTSFSESCYYEPSSTGEQTLTVQEDIVYSWPPAELPTDYWTRPVTAEHREWWPILGNYPGTGYPGSEHAIWEELYPNTNNAWSDRYNFYPWVQSSTTAHVVWKRQDAMRALHASSVQ